MVRGSVEMLGYGIPNDFVICRNESMSYAKRGVDGVSKTDTVNRLAKDNPGRLI